MGDKVPLGSQGFITSAMGLGFMGFTFGYGRVDPEQANGVLNAASDLGVTMIDTSDHYGPRTNEELLGERLRGRRSQFQIATKGGSLATEEGRVPDGRPERLRSALEDSLRRLNADHIDLYYLHRVDPLVPVEESVGAIGEFVAEGKVGFVGLSEASIQSIRRAHAVHPLTAVQSEFSIWSPAPINTIAPVLDELGIGFVPYSPLGRGYLAQPKFDTQALDEHDLRRIFPRFSPTALIRNQPIADAVNAVAARYQCTPAQVALGWIWVKTPGAIPIPGTTRAERLSENWAARRIALPNEAIELLDSVVSTNGVEGDPWPAALMSLLDR